MCFVNLYKAMRGVQNVLEYSTSAPKRAIWAQGLDANVLCSLKTA